MVLSTMEIKKILWVKTISETTTINDHLTLTKTHSSKESHPKAFKTTFEDEIVLGGTGMGRREQF